VRGPALKAAYDAEGKPTGALLGFCRSNGVAVEELRKDETYVWLTKTVVGLATEELLADLLPKSITGLTFEKSMRWGKGRLRFARPIRWLLAAFDGKSVNFEIEGVAAGLESRGHRFYAPETFSATSLESLLKGLRTRRVEPDVDIRTESIREQALAIAGGAPDLPEELVEENAFLVENPTAITGEFRMEHLSLPTFIFIRNSGEDASVRRGAEWVLNARLDDAQFFYKDDSKHDLDYFLEKTSGIVFQEKLGSVRERADRLESLSGFIASQSGASDEEIAWAKLGGRYAKADLSTGLVGDMASLQGVVGGDYARRAGHPEAACWAISSQYNAALNPSPATPNARTALRVCLADNLDKLVGYLGLGLIPTGSSDPYGLRRAATVLIEIALTWPEAALNYKQLSLEAASLYQTAGSQNNVADMETALMELFANRYPIIFPSARYDVLEAATHREDAGILVPSLIATRIAALDFLASDHGFVQTATRPINILSAAKKKGAKFSELGVGLHDSQDKAKFQDALDSTEGRTLYDAAIAAKGIGESLRNGSSEGVISAAKCLEKPINAFFDSTMVMAEDETTRYARLTLVQLVALELRVIGDFTKLVLEG
jgi:glycyl-tRNA synthetase beta chain